MIGSVLFVANVLLYHETAHALVADRYDAFDGFLFAHSKHKWYRYILWGPGIEADENILSDRELAYVYFAPLVLLPLGALSWVGYSVLGYGVLAAGASIFTTAGALAIISDVPKWLGWYGPDGSFKKYWLLDLRDGAKHRWLPFIHDINPSTEVD
jgi:hypothetical protein